MCDYNFIGLLNIVIDMNLVNIIIGKNFFMYGFLVFGNLLNISLFFGYYWIFLECYFEVGC